MPSQIVQRLLQKDDRYTWREHLTMVRALREWQSKLETYPVLQTTQGDVTAYIANFLRPQNIQPIVRSLLACPSISRVIVSNNNPDCRLEKWFHPDHDRVTLLSHTESQSCSMRYTHLHAFPSDFYLIIDDDVFLYPPQIEQLLAELHADPSVPHGLYGQRWEETFFHGGFEQQEMTIDVISRIYAFSSAHLAEVFRVAALIGQLEGSSAWKHAWYDDIFLSFSGERKPQIHNAGSFVDCPTQGKKGTATWREEGFHRSREEIYGQLCAVKPLAA